MTQLQLGLLLVAVSAVVVSWTLYQRKVARLQHAWRKTSGKVLYASLGLGGGFDIDMAYEYFVDGKKYVSTELRTHAVAWIFPAASRERLRTLQAGTTVDVFVNPDDPSVAVIEPGGDPKYPRLMFVIAGFVLLAGLRFIAAGT